ncbi:MAG: hypothetical protein MHM6MM_004862 [Cercozoa sp. M6MM]
MLLTLPRGTRFLLVVSGVLLLLAAWKSRNWRYSLLWQLKQRNAVEGELPKRIRSVNDGWVDSARSSLLQVSGDKVSNSETGSDAVTTDREWSSLVQCVPESPETSSQVRVHVVFLSMPRPSWHENLYLSRAVLSLRESYFLHRKSTIESNKDNADVRWSVGVMTPSSTLDEHGELRMLRRRHLLSCLHEFHAEEARRARMAAATGEHDDEETPRQALKAMTKRERWRWQHFGNYAAALRLVKDSEYILLLEDDVVMSRDFVKTVEAFVSPNSVSNVFSSSGQQLNQPAYLRLFLPELYLGWAGENWHIQVLLPLGVAFVVGALWRLLQPCLGNAVDTGTTVAKYTSMDTHTFDEDGDIEDGTLGKVHLSLPWPGHADELANRDAHVYSRSPTPSECEFPASPRFTMSNSRASTLLKHTVRQSIRTLRSLSRSVHFPSVVNGLIAGVTAWLLLVIVGKQNITIWPLWPYRDDTVSVATISACLQGNLYPRDAALHIADEFEKAQQSLLMKFATAEVQEELRQREIRERTAKPQEDEDEWVRPLDIILGDIVRDMPKHSALQYYPSLLQHVGVVSSGQKPRPWYKFPDSRSIRDVDKLFPEDI